MTVAAAMRGVLVLDGGLGSELERRGCYTRDTLWSARVLLDEPEQIARVHRDYLEAGADCIISASYQISFEGFERAGLCAFDTERALRGSVAIAQQECSEFEKKHGRHALVAASVGPYGAMLANGAEFHGNYGIGLEELMAFHGRRLRILWEARPDVLACETIPSFEEAEALVECLHELPEATAWFTFTCSDDRHTGHGEEFGDCVRWLDRETQAVAIGVNCTAPGLVASLIRIAREETEKPIVVYPNSGRRWDAAQRTWVGPESERDFGALAKSWRQAGARWIGGCCGTTPEDVRKIRENWVV